MNSQYYEERIHRALVSLSSADLQNRILPFPDRNLAIAMDMLGPEDRSRILAVLPPAKAVRLEQENTYLSRLRITARQKESMAMNLADILDGRSRASHGTWIAPGGRT